VAVGGFGWMLAGRGHVFGHVFGFRFEMQTATIRQSQKTDQ